MTIGFLVPSQAGTVPDRRSAIALPIDTIALPMSKALDRIGNLCSPLRNTGGAHPYRTKLNAEVD
jgi:hypothetical protein